MNGYLAFYNGKRAEISADSSWQAVEKARVLFRVPKSKHGLLAVELAEKAGVQAVSVITN